MRRVSEAGELLRRFVLHSVETLRQQSFEEEKICYVLCAQKISVVLSIVKSSCDQAAKTSDTSFAAELSQAAALPKSYEYLHRRYA